MRIQHNITAMNAYRNYNKNTSAVGKNLEKLSSGYRINRAGDDAAGLAVSQKMRLQITGLEQAQKNAKSAISYVQTAEGALQEVHDMLERMYTIAEQSANGTYDDTTDRVQLQKEFDALTTEIDRIGKTSNFNGMGIFSDYEGDTKNEDGVAFWIGPDSFVGDSTDPNVIRVGIMSLNSTDMGYTSKGDTDVQTVSAGDISSISIDSADSAMAALTTIRAASNAISDMRGSLGAIQNRVEHTINNLSVMQENMQDAESVIRDTDVAEEMMKYTKNNILIQSSQAMLAQANQLPQGVLQLLQ